MEKNSLIKNGFWVTYGALTTRLLALVSNLLLARLLLPSEFGVISIAYIFWAFGNLFNQSTAGDFIVYKGAENERYLNTTYTIGISIGLILAAIMVAISPLAANFFHIPDLVGILIVFACNLALSSAQSIYVGVLTSQMQYREIANANSIAAMIRVVCTVSSAILGCSYWSFVIGDAASAITGYFLTRWQVKHRFRWYIDKSLKLEVLSYCLGATGNSLGYYVNANSDNFVIGKLLGSTPLGYYNLGYQLTMAITTIISQAISQVGMSAFAKITEDKKQEEALLKVVEKISLIAAPIYGLFYLSLNKQIITLIFGENWIPVCTVIPGLLIFAYFRLINTSLSSMLSAKGRPQINAKVNLQIAPLALLSFIFAAKVYGIVGVSIAVAFILGIIWTFYWWWVGARELGWSLLKFLIPPVKLIFFVLIAILFSFKASYWFQPILFIGSYFLLIRIWASNTFDEYQVFFLRILNKIYQLKN